MLAQMAQMAQGSPMRYHPTAHVGVRYREHETRTIGRGRNARPDRYFMIRYTVAGKTRTEGLGWESQGFTAEGAAKTRGEVLAAVKSGAGPQSLAELRQARAAAREAERVASPGDARAGLTFADLAARFQRERAAPKQWAMNDARLRLHILPRIGRLVAADIGPGHVKALRQALEDATVTVGKTTRPMSAGTVRHCLTLCRRIVNWARDEPIDPEDHTSPTLFAGQNPFARPGLLTTDSRRLRVLYPVEETMLLEAAQGEDRCIPHMLILTALRTGARLSELLALTPERVQWDGAAPAELVALDTKTGTNRHLIVDRVLGPALAAWISRQPAGWTHLFPAAKRGGPMRVDVVSHAFARIADAVGLNDGVTDPRLRIVFHSLRHTAATRWLAEGVGLYEVSRMLGHASTATTERYLHFAPLYARRLERMRPNAATVTPMHARSAV